jgi:Flp pilus assembly protein TadD
MAAEVENILSDENVGGGDMVSTNTSTYTSTNTVAANANPLKITLTAPENAAFYNERGVCKFQMRFKHAIQDFNEAIRLDPAEPYYYSCRAYIRDKIGDIEGAIKDYSTAHDLDPSDAITLNNLGLAEQKFGYTKKARERFKDSDDLLGIKTIDSMPEIKPKFESIPQPKPTIWTELKNMISSKSGFKSFLKDLGVIKK